MFPDLRSYFVLKLKIKRYEKVFFNRNVRRRSTVF